MSHSTLKEGLFADTFISFESFTCALQLFWRPLQANLEAQERGPEHRQHLHSTERLLSGLQHPARTLSPSGAPGLLPPGGTRSARSDRAAGGGREGGRGVGGGVWAGRAAQVSGQWADDGSPCPSTSERGGAPATSDPEDGEWLREQREEQQQPRQVGHSHH